MNVRQLIQELAGWDGDTEILLASDPEGNGFHRMYGLYLAFINPNGDKNGYVEEIYDPESVMEEDEDLPAGFEPRLVFWP